MTYEKFSLKLEKFIEDNPDIVDEYNSSNTVPLNNTCYSLHKIYETIKDKYPKLSVNAMMKAIVPMAITQKCTVIKVAEDVFDSGVLVESKGKTAMQMYFDDVKRVYDKHGGDYNIEYCPENREKLIEMNLKSVVHIAKSFRGLGLPMEDLICAGNLGLCVSFDKFDPNKKKTRDEILKVLDEEAGETMTYEEVKELLSPALAYGKTKKKFADAFEHGKTYKRNKVKSWLKSNMSGARFNSVAVMWIIAYILIELDNNSRLIKKTKTDIKAEKENGRDVYLDLDETIGDSGNTKLVDMLNMPDDTITPQDNKEAMGVLRDGMALLLDGVKSRNRRILLQKFGIGYPRPMTPKEIAQQEGLSIARVSQIIQATLNKMKENQAKFNVDGSVLFQAVDSLY